MSQPTAAQERKQNNEKIFSVFMSLVMLISITAGLDMTAYADVYTGTCGTDGDNVTWELDTETGVLTISGEGNMENYVYDAAYYYSPWDDYRSLIKKVIINSGVTMIGDFAFHYCTNLESIYTGNISKNRRLGI